MKENEKDDFNDQSNIDKKIYLKVHLTHLNVYLLLFVCVRDKLYIYVTMIMLQNQFHSDSHSLQLTFTARTRAFSSGILSCKEGWGKCENLSTRTSSNTKAVGKEQINIYHDEHDFDLIRLYNKNYTNINYNTTTQFIVLNSFLLYTLIYTLCFLILIFLILSMYF